MSGFARFPALGRFRSVGSETQEETNDRFTRWWTGVESRVISLAQRYLSSPEQARDVAQDVAVAAYLNLETFGDADHFAAWALTRARWTSLDRLRATGRLSSLTDTTASGDASQEVQTLLAEVTALIEQLPSAQRETLKLSVEGYSGAEIAQRLGITAASVRSLRRHARVNLLRRLSSAEHP